MAYGNILRSIYAADFLLEILATKSADRVENLDRYDDRLIVENNLMESYNLLIDFIKKHTDDKFFLIDNCFPQSGGHHNDLNSLHGKLHLFCIPAHRTEWFPAFQTRE